MIEFNVIKRITLIFLIFVLLVNTVSAAELDTIRFRASQYDDRYDSYFGRIQAADTYDVTLYNRAIGLNSNADSYQRQSKYYAAEGKSDEALKYAKLELHSRYGAYFAAYLAEVSYYRNLSLTLKNSYKSEWTPTFDLDEKLEDAERDYSRALTYFNGVASKDFGENTTFISEELEDRLEYDSYLSDSLGIYIEVNKEFEKRIVANEKLEKDRENASKIKFFLIAIVAFLVGFGSLYYYNYFKAKKKEIDVSLDDVEDLELPGSVKDRLNDTYRLVTKGELVPSAIMIGATLEAMLIIAYRWVENKPPTVDWGCGKIFYALHNGKYPFETNMKTRVDNIISLRNDATHVPQISINKTHIEDAFKNLKEVLKYFSERKNDFHRIGSTS